MTACDHAGVRIVAGPAHQTVCAKCGMRPEDIRIAELLAEIGRLRDTIGAEQRQNAMLAGEAVELGDELRAALAVPATTPSSLLSLIELAKKHREELETWRRIDVVEGREATQTRALRYQRDDLQRKLDDAQKQFEIQRDNFILLSDAIYGGNPPDFEHDVFVDAARLVIENEQLKAICKQRGIDIVDVGETWRQRWKKQQADLADAKRRLETVAKEIASMQRLYASQAGDDVSAGQVCRRLRAIAERAEGKEPTR